MSRRNRKCSGHGSDHRKLDIEILESRCLLHGVGPASIVLNGGVLEIQGDQHRNVIDVSLNGSNRIIVTIDGETDPTNPNGYDQTQVQSIEIHGLGGSDRISIVNNIDLPSNITGDQGNDTITGGSGNDSIDGGLGKDSISGGAGDDSLLGGAAKDIIFGGEAGDILNGGLGSDILNGEEGDDFLQTGSGRDTVTGGIGTDVFGPIVAKGPRTDFAVGTDVDAGTPVTVGNFTDAGLQGIRTDLLPGAPDVNERHHDNTLTDSFYVQNGYTNPPTYGPHHFHGTIAGTQSPPDEPEGAPVQPTGIYDHELHDTQVIHNMEHGHVWLSYNPLLTSADDVAKLLALVQTFGGSHRGILLAPRSANTVAIAMVSWAHLETLDGFVTAAVANFIVTNRGHAPEGFITP